MFEYVQVVTGPSLSPNEALEGLFPDGLESSVLVKEEHWGRTVSYVFLVERKKRLDIWPDLD